MAKSFNSIKAGWKNPNSDTHGGRGKKKDFKDIKAADYDFGVDESRINSFLKSSKEYYDNVEKETSSVNYNNAKSKYSSNRDRLQLLRDEARTIRAYYNVNKDKIDTETYKNMLDYLDSFNDSSASAINFYREKADTFSKFKTEDEYNDAVKVGELYDMSSEEILPHIDNQETKDKRTALISKQTALEKQLRELGGSGNKGVGAQKKATLTQELKSVKEQISSLDKNQIAYTTSGGQNITWSSLYNKKKDEEDFNALYNEMSAMPDWEEQSKYIPSYDTSKGGRNQFTNWGDDDYERANFPAVSVNGTQDIYYALQTDEKEKELFNYLAHTKGTDYAIDWLMSREDVYKERQSNQNIKYAQKIAEELPVLSDAMAVTASLVTPFEYLGNVVTGNAGDRTDSADFASAIKGTRMEQIDWEVGEWDAFDFLYGTGTSMAESALAMSTFGGLGGVSLGLNAAAQSTNDALDRGMSKGQAFTSGVASGIFEGIFESWSIGAFGDLTKNLKRADFRNLAKYIGKNMWNNAKEETLTEIANIAYDYLANGDFSQYETAIRQYMNTGMSEADAKVKVAMELGGQVAEAAASGALMGFGFGVGGSVGAVKNTIQSGKEIKSAGETRNVVDLGKSLGEGTESYKYANKITDKSSAYAIGKLLGIEADDITSANKGDIVKSLERKGYSTEVANNLAEMMLDPENTMFENSRGLSAPSQTYNDIINNPNSTVGQRNEAYEGILRSVAENRNKKANRQNTKADTKPTNTAQGVLPLSPNYVEKRTEQLVASGIPIEQAVQVAQGEFAKNQGKMSAQTEKAVESKFESNTEGKDFNMANDKVIASKKLIASDNDKMAFEVTYDDGTTEEVDANDISFGNDGEALVYSTVMDMNVPVGIAESLISGYQGNDVNSAATYISGMREAFVFGKHNQEADLNNGVSSSLLTEEQRNTAFNLGKIYAKEKAIADEKAMKGETKPADIKKQKGKVHFEGDNLSLKSVQDVSLKSINVLSKALGKDIHIFESYEDANGKRVYKDANGNIKKAPNGFYQQLDGSIWIDLNAGENAEGTMMYTVAHELTHFIKQWSPTKFKALADFLVEQYGKEGVSVADLVREQQAKAKRNGREISYDVAFEEMVADSMETMLADGKVIRELAKKDKGLFDKIKSWIDNLLRRLNNEYKNYSPESAEGQKILEMTETFKEVQKLFAEALTEASDNFAIRGSDKAFVENYLKSHDVVYNLRAAESHQDKLAEKYTTDASIDLETLQERYAKIIGIWEKLGGELNSKFLNEWNNKVGKDRAFTIFKAQSGYKYNVELSSMCKKGVPLFEAIDTIVKKEVMNELKTKTLGKAEKEILYDILKNHNFEIPCAICYVEQARQREGVIINDFLDGKIEKNSKGKITKYKLGWNDVLNRVEKEMKKNGVDYTFRNVDKSIATDSYAPADIVMDEATQDAFYKALKKVANAEIVRWNREERKSNQKERRQITDLKPQTIKEVFKGTLPSNLKIFKVLFNNPSSRFKISRDLLYSSATTLNLANAHNDLYSLFNSQGGVSGYKTKQAPIVYWGDILGKSWRPSTVRKEGGIRNQSNSDFQMYTLLDQAQMYIDFSAKGYYLQAYTKVLAELKLFGLSRGKINASLIPQVIEYKNADGSINWAKTMENAGLDENGNPIYDDFEGINHTEAFMLIEDAEYSKNICGICIGYSDNHIRKLLDDNRVQQIIGFHDKTDNPEKRYRGAKYAKNYNGLNEAVKVKADGTEETVHIGFNQFVSKAEKMFKFNKKTETFEGTVNHNGKEYSANDIPRLAADLYLEMCAEKNYRPAYNDFSSHKNYYKLLADFGLYDSQGNYAPHQKVQYNMPDKVPYLDKNGNKSYMSTESYIKAELQKELTVRDSISEALADTSENGIIPQFVERVNALHSEKDDTTLHSDRDKAYMDAVNNGDMETAQRLVDEAAKEAGYSIKAYHGTKADFTKFSKEKFGSNFGNWSLFGAGFYFALTEERARYWGDFSNENTDVKVMPVYLRTTNMISADEPFTNDKAVDIVKKEAPSFDSEDIAWTLDRLSRFVDFLTHHGYTANSVQELFMSMGYDGVDYSNLSAGKYSQYVVFNPEQIKSADLVTYDDEGNVIPLSQRFNEANDDIRYSDRDSEGNTLSKEQQEFFKDSKVRDAEGNLLPVYHGTYENFTIFDITKTANANIFGKGHYFTSSESDAKDNYASGRGGDVKTKINELAYIYFEEMGYTEEDLYDNDHIDEWNEAYDKAEEYYESGKVIQVYLNITNPVYADNTTELYDKDGNFISARTIEDLKKLGFDGIVDYHVSEKFGFQRLDENTAHYIAFDSNQIKLTSNTNPTSNPDIRYSERSDYKQQVDEVIKNTHDPSNHVYMGTTPIRLSQILDLPRLPMLITSNHIYSMTVSKATALKEKRFNKKYHYHDLGADIVKALPDALNNPVMIIKSNTDSNDARFVVVTDLVDKNNNPIIAALEPYGEGKYWNVKLDANVTVSGYGKDGFGNYLTTAKNEGRILYAYKKYSQQNKNGPGVYFSDSILSADYSNNLARFKEIVNKKFLEKHPIDKGWTVNQPGELHSERDTDSVSTRSLLANALEGTALKPEEKNLLRNYKTHIRLIEGEQKKLHEVREKLFTKGINGEERKKLQFEAKLIATRINSYDKELFKLEAMQPMKDVLAREKELARKRQKQKDAENLREYKEKVAETTRQLLEKNRQSREKAIEGRNKTEMRHKIKKVVGDLNNLLLKPTKERHIPEEMRVAVAEALDIINMDTVDAETRVARYNELIAKEKNPDVIASLTESRDRILNQGNKLGEKLKNLKDAYGMIRDSADDDLKSMYDDVIYNKIESVQKKVGKTPLRNMTLEQLENVYELYKMVLTTVRDSNKAFAEDLKMTRQALGSNTFAEIKENNKARDRIRFEGAEKFGWKYLKPMLAMKTIGSDTLQKLWNNILYGQEVFAQDYDEAVKFAKEMKEKYGYKEWDLHKLYSFESKSGKVMKINLEQMMSIYAYSKRKQADEHIEKGGILLNESIIKEKKLGRTVEVKVNDSTAYRLDKMQVGEIIDTLEKIPGAKDFVDEMQKYLSETMGEKGNEVSMKMYGIKLFKEEHYFPLKSSKDFMESANAKLKGDVKIKNKGMTKATVEHASNPIVLEGFLDVWGNHINEMAMYHGLVLPLEDFSRTLNYGFKADDKLNADAESVRTALRSAFGESADNYLNELLKAINGGVLHDSSTEFADKMISTFKKSKVMASLSVIVQQPTAIIRAMGIIESKYFTSQNFHHKQTWEELKKYCPTAIIKETGSFDTNMGRTIVDMVKEDRKFTEKVGDALGKAPAWMDEMGWNMIWRALKKKVATEQNLSGEALLKECGKQMTLIINETQVYDSVMSRNEFMRSKGAFTKMATAFMGEPTTVANMIYGAALDIKRGNKRMAGKTVAAVISSVVINGLVSSLVYALRDDDEEKTWLEKYLASATTEVIDGINPLTYIPYIKDAYSLFQGYDVERTDMALIGDVVDALDDFFNVFDPEAYEDMSRGEIAKHIYESSIPLLTSICDMFGLPVGNILRDAKAIILNDNLPMSKTSSEGSGLAVKEGWLNASPKFFEKFVGDEKYHKLYLIANNGDTAYVKNEVAEMVAEKFDSYKDEETTSQKAENKAKQSVKSSFTGVYRDEYKKAYKNKDSEEMNRIRKFLYATGLWKSLSELDSLLAKWREAD